MRLQPELVEMTINGVSVDERLQSKFADELGRSLEDARAAMSKQGSCMQLAYQITNLIPEVLLNLLSSSLTDLHLVGRGTSTDKENRDRITKASANSASS